jgi:hypothetical protein
MKDSMGNWSFLQKLVASDRNRGELFGTDIDIEGDIIVVGTYYEDGVYIYENDGTNNWVETQKIVGSDLASDVQDFFGESVSISGNTIVVGSYLNETDENSENMLTGAGSAYIFDENSDGVRTEVQKIAAPDRDAAAFFGCSVSIFDDYLICGAYEEEMDENPLYQSGAAYFFKRNDSGTWNMTQKVVASNRGSITRFARAVHLDGSTAVIGSHLIGPVNGGTIYIYNKDNTGNWNEDQIINAPDTSGNDFFGHSLDKSGNRMVVGAFGHNFDENAENEIADTGAAYIYDNNGNDQWTLTEKVVASDRGIYAGFGWSVGISGSTCLVGSEGSGYTAEDQSLFYKGSAYIFETDTPQSIQEQALSDFGIYPNPTQGYLSFAKNLNGNNVILYNTLGQVVMNQTIASNRLELHNLQPGIYLLRADGYKTQTFMVQ